MERSRSGAGASPSGPASALMPRARASSRCLKGATASLLRRRDRGAARAVGRRQVDAAPHRGPARTARWRRRGDQRRRLRQARRQRADPHAPLGDRLRLSVPPSPAGILGARERRAAAAHPWLPPRPRPRTRGQGAPRTRSALPSAGIIARRSSPAASSSAWPSPAPSPTGRRLLLADEPTGNLDPPTAERVFEQLLKLVRQSGVAALIATHNLELAARMDRTLRLKEGLLVEEEVVVVRARGRASAAPRLIRTKEEHKIA